MREKKNPRVSEVVRGRFRNLPSRGPILALFGPENRGNPQLWTFRSLRTIVRLIWEFFQQNWQDLGMPPLKFPAPNSSFRRIGGELRVQTSK